MLEERAMHIVALIGQRTGGTIYFYDRKQNKGNVDRPQDTISKKLLFLWN